MDQNGIVPDVIQTAPKAVLKVVYKDIEANLGNEVTPTQVKKAPTVEWAGEDGQLYTLAMVDPDAPSRQDPKFREWHHWLVVNIPGKDVGNGEVLSEYIGAAPPKNTGLHRYVFLIYQQLGKLRCDEGKLTAKSGAKRGKFSISKFAKKYNLGDPIAGNYFVAKWDEYCEVLKKQLTEK